jgi:ectoine hydroxylase-related dioxygenase (phytanoyl-CoA dioxygenase family)
MPKQKYLKELEKDGLVVVPQVLGSNLVSTLILELEAAISEDATKYPDAFDAGMVHNCMVRGSQMGALLDNSIMNAYIDAAFSNTSIIYAYQSSSLQPKSENYGSRVHVDCPRFVSGYYTNMGIMFALNDFTIENGATYYLPGSHKLENPPSEDEFYKHAKRACCKAGDMIILNARLVHAAGLNTTNQVRHALTMNLCRSYMRQRFDLPRLVPQNIIDSLGTNGRRLLGMNVRVPTSLEDFYLPVDQRLYKANQG